MKWYINVRSACDYLSCEIKWRISCSLLRDMSFSSRKLFVSQDEKNVDKCKEIKYIYELGLVKSQRDGILENRLFSAKYYGK